MLVAAIWQQGLIKASLLFAHNRCVISFVSENMVFNRGPKFEVCHFGRGGTINYKYRGKKGSFNIEMGPDGNFFVFTGKSPNYTELRLALRKYLDSTNRDGWVMDE